jgi:hypothetical protein
MALAALGGSALALHRETPGAVRLGGDSHSQGRSWARYNAFSSTENLLGDGSTGRQIFVWRHFNWVCQNGKPTAPTAAMCPNPPEPFLYRVTNGPGSPDHPSVSDTFETNGTFPQPPLAQWVTFEADGSYNGSTGCEASRRQIFLFEVYSKELRQITFGCDGDSTNPTLSFHGGLVAFESTASGIAPGAVSPPGVKQIYTYYRSDLVIRKVTAGAADSSYPMVNKIGTRVTFQSSSDILGTQLDTGIQQIFWSDYDRRRHRHEIHQLTNGNADSEHPYNAEDRPFVAFESEATDLPGSFAPGGRQIYIARVDTEPVADLPPVTQLTNQSQFGQCTWPAVDPGNSRVGFICTQDPTPLGTPGNRVYTFDLEEGRLYQVSAASDVTGPIGFNHGPWFVSLVTSADLNGTGTCGRRLWLVDYFAGPQDGNSKIGVRRFAVQPGDAVNGSEGQLVTKDGTLIGDVRTPGFIDMRFESPDPGVPDPVTRGETIVTIPMGYAHLPPIPFPGVGAICIQQTGAGGGTLDCDGGKPGSHVSIRQDHFTDDEDPSCIRPGACREDDPDCHGSLVSGPHLFQCPRCTNVPGLGPRCNIGNRIGLFCTGDAFCRLDYPNCQPGLPNEVAMCNGPMLTEFTGTYGGGSSVLNLPVSFSLSLDPGPDTLYCTDDDPKDPYFAARTPDEPLLRLTTDTATARIIDPNGIQTGASLGTDAVGGPMDCTRLRAADLTGAELVASIPFLDINLPGRPLSPITDAVFSLRLEAKPRPIDVCGIPCASNVECNDLDACNGVETCSAGFCTAGTPVVCDDGNACNGNETCSPTTGACLAGQPPLCEDGNPCNGTETCDPTLGCVAGAPLVCNDANPCNGVESCNPLTGGCLPGIPLCDDLNPCNGTEVCDPVTATCSPGTPVDCDDKQLCNGVETCDPATGACKAGVPKCDNGNPCDGVESCNATTGACGPSPANTVPVCTGDPCNPGLCDPKSKQTDPCVYKSLCDDGVDCNGVATCTIEVIPSPTGPPTILPRCTPPADTNLCDDGDPCNGVESCSTATGRCVSTPPPCDDGNVCDGIETCAGGTCGAGTPLDCDDLNPCTDDSCDAVQGCVHTFNVRPCDDGTLCTTNDACSLGVCRGKEILCSDDNACNGFETCDAATGTCVPGTPPVCDDANDCTNDSCDPALGCQQIPNANPCDDASVCTTNDACRGGVCTGDPACSDGDKCNGEELCDPGSGACSPAPAPLNCDDANTCTDDTCQPAVGCVYTNQTGTSCDDVSACTQGDVCSNGACVGTPLPCDDGDACNGVEVCNPVDGSCPGAPAPNCDDGIACTIDSCDPVTGCRHDPPSLDPPGLLCLLNAIEASLNGAPPLAFRNGQTRTKLLRLIAGAQRKTEKVVLGASRSRPLLGKVRRALDIFGRRVRFAQGRLYIEQNYGDQLIAMARPAHSLVVALVKPSVVAKFAVSSQAAAVSEAAGVELAGTTASGPECTND